MQPSAPDFRAKILAYGEVLKRAVDTLRDAPEHWHKILLIELATENLVNARKSSRALRNRMRAGARGVRNLLEFTTSPSAVQSPENAQRFHEDMLCDYQDILKVIAKHPEWASYGVSAQAAIDQGWQMPDINAEKATPTLMHVRSIARSFGEEIHYGTTHKSCRNLSTRPPYRFR